MFEGVTVQELDARGCADALAESVAAQRRLDARRVATVAHWADLHPVVDETDADPAWTRLRRRTQTRAESYGADGTPAVSEFAATELGMLLQTTTASAGSLLRDVLDLRHRHPRLHQAVLSGAVDLWQARQVVRATARAGLSLEQSLQVDAEVLDALTGLPFGRAMTVVEGRIIAADPDKHERRRAEEAGRRYVSVGRRPNELGLRTLVAQSTAGDVARFYAMISHLADAMLAGGDTEPAPVRRAKALALLANPAMACVFLAEARARHDQRLAGSLAADTCTDADASDDDASDSRSGPQVGSHRAEPLELPEPSEPHVSAADLAVGFGNQLHEVGPGALERLRPRTVLYLHLAEEAVSGSDRKQAVRTEGLGALSIDQLKEWLSTAAGVDHVVVKPVIDPAGITPVDAYEVPPRMRESLELTHPFEVFPYGTLASRRADADHVLPYLPMDRGGPPGQTRLDNLGPLGRTHHRAKTFGGFTVHQPLPGMYLWRTPTGHWFQVDSTGTHPLGSRHPELLRRQRRRVPTTGYAEAVADIQVVCDWAA